MTAPNALSRTDNRRIAFGVLPLPLVGFLVALVVFPLIYPRDDHFVHAGLPRNVRIAIVVAISAVPLTVIGAMWTTWWRLRRGSVSCMHALTVGIIVGNIPWLFFSALQASHSEGVGFPTDSLFNAEMLRPVAFASCVGLFCALVFWIIARQTLQPRKQS